MCLDAHLEMAESYILTLEKLSGKEFRPLETIAFNSTEQLQNISRICGVDIRQPNDIGHSLGHPLASS